MGIGESVNLSWHNCQHAAIALTRTLSFGGADSPTREADRAPKRPWRAHVWACRWPAPDRGSATPYRQEHGLRGNRRDASPTTLLHREREPLQGHERRRAGRDA